MNIYNFWDIFHGIDSYIIISFLLVFLILLIADYYDLKYGIIPNKLSIFLFIYGVMINSLMLFALKKEMLLCCYFIYLIIIFIISFVLWKMSFWGGGDLKLFCSMGSTLLFIDILNPFLKNSILNNFAFNNQIILYPRIFSVLLNSIIFSFPILLLYLIYRLYREDKLNSLFLIFSDIKSLIKFLSVKKVNIDDLEEGMVLEKYYFRSSELFDIFEIAENKDDVNLTAGKFGDSYYFKSASMLGLTREDLRIIELAYKKGLIDYPNFEIKIGIPFLPSLTVGYLVFLIFGDLIYVISTVI